MSRTIPQSMKDKLLKVCCNCGATDGLQYHHIVPQECGGKTKLSNIAVVCNKCHSVIHYGREGVICQGELIRRGQAEARARGAKIGKPPADYEKVMRMIAENSTQFNARSTMTEHEIMDMAGVKEVCYAKCKKMLIEKMESEEWPYEWSKPTQKLKRPLYDRVIKKKRGETRGCV